MTPEVMRSLVRLVGVQPKMIAALDGGDDGPGELPEGAILKPDVRCFFESPEQGEVVPFFKIANVSPGGRVGEDEHVAHYIGTFDFIGGAASALHAWEIADVFRQLFDGGGIPLPQSYRPHDPELVRLWISACPSGVSWSEPNGCYEAQGQATFETNGFPPVEGEY